MSAYNKFNQFVEDLGKKKHDLSADTFKVMLTNSAPTAGNAVKGDLTEISAANGYTAGGPTATVSSCAQTSGVLKWILADITVTAAGGSFGPFRYLALYNNTQTSPNKPLIGFWDAASNITINDTENLVMDFDGSLGVLQIS